jgi:DNA-binding NtrC family response regulator
MLGSCDAMLEVFETIDKIAPTELTVLVLGASGTGKELAARSLHRHSRRAAGPFVALNCGALPSSLLESELFGFEKGSVTGAVGAHEGHIERADGGTLFLDEIAEMPLGAQAKLLRVLQDHRVQRLGASRDRKIDLRVVAATHQDLSALVESRAFRRDLFHRLNEVQLSLPALRDRGEDLQLLATSCLERFSRDLGRPFSLSDAAWQALAAHDWPGNVRELENCLHRATALAHGSRLEVADLRLSALAAARTLAEVVATAQEQAIRNGLRRHAGVVSATAAELGISEDELRQLAAQHAIAL